MESRYGQQNSTVPSRCMASQSGMPQTLRHCDAFVTCGCLGTITDIPLLSIPIPLIGTSIGTHLRVEPHVQEHRDDTKPREEHILVHLVLVRAHAHRERSVMCGVVCGVVWCGMWCGVACGVCHEVCSVWCGVWRGIVM